jgi:phosphoadenosine phosphosulfate reductase
MSLSAADLPELAAQAEHKTPQEILALCFERCGHGVALSFSGAEDVVLVDMAVRLRPDVKVFCLDTGRLHPETYRFLDRVRERYSVALECLFPEAAAVEAMVQKKGLFSFFKDGHQECCGIRKVLPLKKKLATLDAWVTGQRRDQSPTRADVPVVQLDKAFSGPGRTLVKWNPLTAWSSADVWRYIRDNEVPYNELHERGFTSIGCEPCTRPILPNAHEREGRWWWEEATRKECGLHAAANLRKP